MRLNRHTLPTRDHALLKNVCILRYTENTMMLYGSAVHVVDVAAQPLGMVRRAMRVLCTVGGKPHQLVNVCISPVAI